MEISPGQEGRSEVSSSQKETQSSAFHLREACETYFLFKTSARSKSKSNRNKKGVAHFFGALGPGLLEAESHDAEIFAVEDELRGVELQLLVGAQHLPFPLCIIYWEKQMPITSEPVLFLPQAV